jgi:alpha-mannosidase
VRAAYELNDPLIVYPFTGQGGTLPLADSLFQVDALNVILETVKRAENGDGVILRLYECYRQRGPVTIWCSRPIIGAWETNLLERNEMALPVQEGHAVTLFFTPYQIRTLRLRLR